MLGPGDFLAEQVRAVGVEYVAVDQTVQLMPLDAPWLLAGTGYRQQPDAATSRSTTDDRAVGGHEELRFREVLDEPVADALLPRGMKMGVDLVDCDYAGKRNRPCGGVDRIQRRFGNRIL